jgi:GAF domain-containing protein
MPDSFTQSLTRIMQAIHALQSGEYAPAMLEDLLQSEDEFGELARMVDIMAQHASLRDHQLKLLQRVIPVGVALSVEKDFNRLLETLVIEAQSVTNADAGTLYLLEGDQLRFVILRNTSLDLQMGGTSGKPITFQPVTLHNEDGSQNHVNVASFAALTRRRVNLEDAYQAEGFDFSGTRNFDARSGYRSQSFLTIPLESAAGQVIGVLQLINARHKSTGAIVPFDEDNVLDSLVLLASAALDGYIREEKLRQEIAKLRIEIDETHRASVVADITESQYFKQLQDRVHELRSRYDNP